MAKRYTDEQNKKWREGLPKKTIAAKVIVRSDRGKILLVKPDYKDTWQLLGGGVDAHEDPKAAAAREAKEEANVNVQPSDLRLVDTIFKAAEDQLFLMYECERVFLEDGDYSVEDEEIETYEFVEPREVAKLLPAYYTEFWESYAAGTSNA